MERAEIALFLSFLFFFVESK